jgi:hypothetical protein
LARVLARQIPMAERKCQHAALCCAPAMPGSALSKGCTV